MSHSDEQDRVLENPGHHSIDGETPACMRKLTLLFETDEVAEDFNSWIYSQIHHYFLHEEGDIAFKFIQDGTGTANIHTIECTAKLLDQVPQDPSA